MASNTPPDKLEEEIFEIVNQLNRGAHLITSLTERESVAGFNLVAGRRAKISTAYASALKYLHAGRALLTDETWNRNHTLVFSIECLLAECEVLTADMSAAEGRLSMLAERAKSSNEIALVARLRMTLYHTTNRSHRAVEVFVEYWKRPGEDWSPHPTSEEVLREYNRIWSLLGNRQIEELIDLPLVTDPDARDAMDVLTEVGAPALIADANFYALVGCRMVTLSLEQGNSDGSCYGYMTFSLIAGPHFGNYQAGFRFGKLGYDLVEERGLHRYQSHTYMGFGGVITPWSRHFKTGRELVRRSFDAASRIGSLITSAACGNILVTNFLAAGDPLAEAQHEAETYLEFAANIQFGLVIDIITVQLGLIRTLRGLTARFGTFDDERFDELRFERHLGSEPVVALPACWYWIRKVQARFLAGDYPSAIEASSKAEPLLWTSPSMPEVAEYHFYSALSRAASFDCSTDDSRQRHFEALTAHQKQQEIWAQHCPENFENRAALVGAEIARIEGRVLEAEQLYEQAIRSAHSNGFVHNEAIAYELAARFYAARGFQKFADAYLLEARFCYERWGADGKVAQLDQLYPHLKKQLLNSTPTSTILAPAELLDLATVIKVSKAVSGEMILGKLIDSLMRAAIEQAGAERGLLIVPRHHELQIEAEATITKGDVSVRLRDNGDIAAAIPASLVRYVMRTQENVILENASSSNPFSADPYIVQHRPRSILTLPLINRGTLIGILHLENNLTPHVFTPERITVLKVLASQAAMSLENTRLYRDLADRERKIRRLVDANVVGIVMWNLEGAITDANDAFLRMVQFNREDLASGRVRWTDLTPAEYGYLVESAIGELKASGVFRPVEMEYFRKDGSRFPILAGGALFEDSGNEGVAFVLDLSEQKRAEQALQRSESYLAEAQRLTLTGSCAIDGRSRETVYWSEEMFRLFGFDPGQGLPTWDQWLQRVHPDDRGKIKLAGDRTFLEKVDCDIEFRLVKCDGTIKHIHAIGHPILSPNGELAQVVGTMVDITDRRRADEARDELRQLEADLAHINRVSTMGELAASLAHEIKQPIGAAVTNAEACLLFLGRNQPDLPEAREAALEMARDARRAADIIERVRSLYRKDSSQREIVDVNEVIREMVLMLQNEANRHSVMMRTDLTEGLPQVMSDRVQIQQVLMNLMMNGIEAMRDAGGELSIKSQLAGDGQLLILVIDSGVGLPAGKAHEIFHAFFTTKSQGTGLGLAITRSIVESHGGRVWATANSGQGATFQFTLPTKTAAHA